MKFRSIEFTFESLKETTAKEWFLRFVFGGLISVLAGMVAQKFGPVIGGLFLAFPSILPATVTLVKKRDGRVKAADDADGAIIGSIAMVFFAMVILETAEAWGPVFSLIGATFIWIAVSAFGWRLLG